MGKKRKAVKSVQPQAESGEENNEESLEESLQSTPPPPQPSESDEPERTKHGQHSSDGGKKTRLTAAKRPSEDTERNDVKKIKAEMEEAQHSSYGGRKTRLSSAKRPSEDPDRSDIKNVPAEKKSHSSPRVWSEEDEIVLLNGMLDYWNEKESDPTEDWSAFYEFMRGKEHSDYTKVQMQDKVRRLKKKFKDIKEKRRKYKNAKERAFSTPHEQSLYDLSMQIWGNKRDASAYVFEEIEDGGNVGEKPNGKVNAEETEDGGNAVGEKANGKVNATVFEEIEDGGNAVGEKASGMVNASVFEEIEDGDNAVGKKPSRKVNASVFEEVKVGGNAVGKKPSRKVNASVFEEVKVGGYGGKLKEQNPSASMEETMLLTGREILRKEGKTEWHKLRVEEMELYLKQLELRVVQTKIILEHLKHDHRGEDGDA